MTSKDVDGADKFPMPKGVGRPKEVLPEYEQKKIKRDVLAVVEFQPSDLQERVKARFFRNTKDASHIHDLDSIVANPQLIEKYAGTVKISAWLEKDGFREWFFNESHFQDQAMALRSKALQKINDILEGEFSQDADAIKAAKLIFDITGSYPTKQQEVRFLDERIGKMSPIQVKEERARLEAQLGDDILDGEEVE